MRFFCTQPDIVEDVQAVRYQTKSSGVGPVSSRPQTAATGKSAISKTAPPASRAGTVSDIGGGVSGGRLNRSRTAISARGKKLFGGGERKGSIGPYTTSVPNGKAVSVGGASISAPIPIENGIGNGVGMGMGIGNGNGMAKGVGELTGPMSFLHVSPPPMIVQTGGGGNANAPQAPPPMVINSLEMERDKSKSLDITIGSGMVTDSEREGAGPKQLRRKSRRMSAPLAALGINIGNIASGTDTDTTVKRRRVSKIMIGAPEGFKHEGHVGMGATFISSTEMPDSWNVEAWRAEIERTLTSATIPPTLSRPKGPRPTSVSSPISPKDAMATPTNPSPSGNTTDVQPRNRYRRSIDGAAPRRSIDGYGGNSGAMTDAPMRHGNSPVRHRSGSGSGNSPSRQRSGSGSAESPSRQRSGSNGSPHRRSRSGSLSRSPQTQGQPGQASTPGNYSSQTMGNLSGSGGGRQRGMGHGHSLSQGNPSGGGGGANSNEQGRSNGLGHAHSLSHPQSHSHGQGHTLGKGSITSLASIPTSTSTSTAHTTILTPNTTSTSLSRSLSEKPYHPSHHAHHHPSGSGGSSNGHYQQHQPQQYHQHLQHLGHPPPNPYYHNGGGAGQFGMNGTNGPPALLQRSSSATAALPPSSSTSSATVASMTSTASSATAYGGHPNGATVGTGRKPIPAQRRKPVPQHLPATAEVSPFPTLLVVNNGVNGAAGGKGRDSAAEGKRAPFPFDVDLKRQAYADQGIDVVDRGGDAGPPPVPTKREKEMVPLLGVPGDEAHYVTKSTKARWDGAMAEIATALRDPNAEAPPL